MMWFDTILVIILLICLVTDMKRRRIYNKVIFPGLFIAFFSHLIFDGWEALVSALLGFLVGFSILLIPYLLGGMGAGDVKLLALIGALKGVAFVIDTAINMALLGGLLAILVLLFKPDFLRGIYYFFLGLRYGVKFPHGLSKSILTATYPYGMAIAGGAFFSLWFGGWGIL